MSRIGDFFLGEITKSHSTAADKTNEALGQTGSIIIDDTVEHTGPFIAITVIGTEDAVIDTSECNLGTLEDQPATITIPKGGTIFGNFTSIELDSGVIIAYRASS
tara:strand:+ start:1480 stop:1794 length:315 start_codon:yes stop_codon:yes gene_type:complete